MGELDLDKIERTLEPEWEEKRPQERKPLVIEQEIVDKVPPRRDDCECLAKARK